jgi:hypothetical protein
MRAAAAEKSVEDSMSDRALALRAELHRARLDIVTANARIRRAADSPDREAEAQAAEVAANAAGRLAGFARLLAAELAATRAK